jgi:hypothetical protein
MRLNEQESPPQPRAQVPADARGEYRSDATHGTDNSVGRVALVVDDDPFFRVALREILTRHLCCSEVIEAASFDEAI